MAWNELNASRLDRWVRRLTGIRQPGVLSAMMGELAAVAALPTGPEDDAIAGRVPFAAPGAIVQDGAVGSYFSFAVENTLPGRIVVVQGEVLVDRQDNFVGQQSWRLYMPGDSRTLGPVVPAGCQPRDGRIALVPALRAGNIAAGSPSGRLIAFGISSVTEVLHIPLPPLILPPAPASSGTGFPAVAEYRFGEIAVVGTDPATINLWGWSREIDSSEDAPL